MPGVRIAPTKEAMRTLGLDDAAGRVWVVRDLSRPLTGPPYPPCQSCGHHEVKTYHLQLDADGAVMVSETIWHHLQNLLDNPFEQVNAVSKPPVQRIVLPPAAVSVHTPTL